MYISFKKCKQFCVYYDLLDFLALLSNVSLFTVIHAYNKYENNWVSTVT